MPDTFELEVATPDRLLVREQATAAQIPARKGYLGILPGHAPLLAELGTGFMHYTAEGRRRHLAIHGGLVEVLGDRVRVLADEADLAEDIDVERATEDLRRAQQELAQPALGVDPAIALRDVARAQARLDAATGRA